MAFCMSMYVSFICNVCALSVHVKASHVFHRGSRFRRGVHPLSSLLYCIVLYCIVCVLCLVHVVQTWNLVR
jgi:hypothetical protein